MKHVDMDEIYRRMTPQQIPWNLEEPPEALVDLVNGARVQPCKAVDFGCGIGNYAIYLASRGFSYRNYLWPIKNSTLTVNSNLVQNPGW